MPQTNHSHNNNSESAVSLLVRLDRAFLAFLLGCVFAGGISLGASFSPVEVKSIKAIDLALPKNCQS